MHRRILTVALGLCLCMVAVEGSQKPSTGKSQPRPASSDENKTPPSTDAKTADAQSKESLERTGVDLEDLARRLSALKASQFSIFIDACREDPFPGRGIKGNTMTDVMSRGLRIAPSTARPDGLPPTSIVFYACN